MTKSFENKSLAEIGAILTEYLDGLYDGDLEKFARVFHEASHLYSSDGSSVTDWPRESYFERIGARESARSQGLARHDRIVSVHQSGPATAFAVVECAIPPRFFTDYLTLLRTDRGWRIISKTFHTVVHE